MVEEAGSKGGETVAVASDAEIVADAIAYAGTLIAESNHAIASSIRGLTKFMQDQAILSEEDVGQPVEAKRYMDGSEIK